jgi:nitroimidazol reductase NimA-like FMN-containing flavoprotein (pyridoxamine 5'-phosphate oxidase superfamily)
MNNFSNRHKVKVTQKERKFLLENEVCRIATSHDDVPHVVPVAYIYDKDAITFVTDYGTRKYKNLEVNKNVSVVVDVYDHSGENKAIILQGKAVIIERGAEFKRLYQIFNKRFEWVRKNPWKEGEAPFVRVDAFNKVSWRM